MGNRAICSVGVGLFEPAVRQYLLASKQLGNLGQRGTAID